MLSGSGGALLAMVFFFLLERVESVMGRKFAVVTLSATNGSNNDSEGTKTGHALAGIPTYFLRRPRNRSRSLRLIKNLKNLLEGFLGVEGLGLYSLLTESKMCARITSLTNEPGLPLREIVGLKRRTVFPTALRWREGSLGKGRQGFDCSS